MSTHDRSYDLVLFGATGFTGTLTATYVARHAPAHLRFALAGRNRDKLELVKQQLMVIDPRWDSVGIVEANVDDDVSLQRMAASTQVLLTTVGPFIDYGLPVAQACVEQGTDYIDSTGEPQYVDLLLRRCHARALERGVRLVPSCGFDSVPADLGVLFTILNFPQDMPIAVSGYLSLKAAPSGGTERSAIKTFAPRTADNPPLPVVAPSGRRVHLAKARVQKKYGGWASPLETIDGTIVTRSAAAMPRYGVDFTYAHHVVHPSFAVMILAFLFFGGLSIFARVAAVREFFLKVAKKSGQGPSAALMSKGWFTFRFEGRCGDQSVSTEVSGGEPFYTETSKILAEAALCLIENRADLPTNAGVLTPASAMGEKLIDRLQQAGIAFRTVPNT